MSNSTLYTLETLPRVPENTTSAERANLATAMRTPETVVAQNRFMTASELVAFLQKQIEQFGDLPVVINSEDTGYVTTITPHNMSYPVIPFGLRHAQQPEMHMDAIALEIGTNWSRIV